MSPAAVEQAYLRQLAHYIRDSIDFFSSSRKSEREKWVVATFLHYAGVAFSTHEIQSCDADPPDVLVKTARFEVMEILAPGRRRHAEYKELLRRCERARTIEDIAEPYTSPAGVTPDKLLQTVEEGARRKAAKYGDKAGDLDLLVYVNNGTFLVPSFPIPAGNGLRSQKWRSVSILIMPLAWVVFASQGAPRWLRQLAGTVKQQPNSLCLRS